MNDFEDIYSRLPDHDVNTHPIRRKQPPYNLSGLSKYEKFIIKSTYSNGKGKYSYDEVDFSEGFAVDIKCNTHETYFTANSKEHARGNSGCPECKKEKGLWTLEKILNKNPHYADLWDYTESNLPLHLSAMITVTCKKHNTPTTHSMQHHVQNKPACPKCKSEAHSKPRVSTEEFKERASKIHNDFYDYSKSEYIGRHKKLTILCPLHGEFKQTAGNHLNGQGCWFCRNDKIAIASKTTNHINDLNKNDQATLYVIRFHSNGVVYYKVGITRRGTKTRFVTEPRVEHYQILMEFESTFESVVFLEDLIIREFDERKARFKCQDLKGELYGWTECFREKDFDINVVLNVMM